jgi:parallel beta-helix repeat protein
MYHACDGHGGGICCVYGSRPTLIGSVIANNAADSESGGGFGGGLYCGGGACPTLTNCTITGNEAASAGAGMCCMDGSNDGTNPTLIDCRIANNLGDGVFCYDNSNPTLTACEISGNSRTGVLCTDNSSPTLVNCEISDNDYIGVYFDGYCHLTLTNCVITSNYSYGVECSHSDPTLTNCLISNNSGHGVSCWHSGPTLTNCIIWDDTLEANYSDPIVTYCDIEGGWSGEGNLNADPLFVDPDNGDYHLGDGSPCIDAGNNEAVPEGIDTDLDGNPRFVDDPDTEDTGYGTPPIVDMGAYEFQVEESCPADFDGNGQVDHSDLEHLLGCWGTPCGDVDGDGDTDTADLLALLGAWGDCP